MKVPFVFISILYILCKSRRTRDVQKGKTEWYTVTGI